jgi:hypothetical protein
MSRVCLQKPDDLGVVVVIVLSARADASASRHGSLQQAEGQKRLMAVSPLRHSVQTSDFSVNIEHEMNDLIDANVGHFK